MRSGVMGAGVVLVLLGGMLVLFVPGTPDNQTGIGAATGSAGAGSVVVIGVIMAFFGILVMVAGLAASPAPGPRAVGPSPTAWSGRPPDPEEASEEREPRRPVFYRAEEEAPPGPVTTPSSSVASIWNPRTGEEKDAMPGTHYCPECGFQSPTSAKFCQRCGRIMPSPPS